MKQVASRKQSKNNAVIDWRNLKGIVSIEYDRQNKEVLQIINQRFMVVTIAIGGAATVLGWVATIFSASGSINGIRVLSLSGILFLGLMFALSHLLLRTARLITTSIIARYEVPVSPLKHEHIWHEFRNTGKKYSAYTRPYGWIFVLLGFIVWVVPFALRCINAECVIWDVYELCILIVLAIFLLLVILFTESKIFLPNEKDLIIRWEQAITKVKNR